MSSVFAGVCRFSLGGELYCKVDIGLGADNQATTIVQTCRLDIKNSRVRRMCGPASRFGNEAQGIAFIDHPQLALGIA